MLSLGMTLMTSLLSAAIFTVNLQSASRDGAARDTPAIQRAIDAAAAAGGGEVRLPAGEYHVGGLVLKSGVTLHLERCARLIASRNPKDYEDKVAELAAKSPEAGMYRADRWENAIIRMLGAKDVAIIGELGSVIDGRNCADVNGEEHYRGPHGISAVNCTNVTLRGYTLTHTGNWAHRILNVENISVQGVTVLGGHDGFHVRLSDQVRVNDCFFDTGDDGIAGFGNRDVVVSNCVLKSACSPVRFGGRDVLITDCTADGGSYPHRWTLSAGRKERGETAAPGEGRRNMGCFFQYFTNDKAQYRWSADNMVFRNIVVKNADLFACSLTGLGLIWNKGPGIPNIRFENVRVENCRQAGVFAMPPECPLKIVTENCSFAFRQPQAKGFDVWNATFENHNLKTKNLNGPFAVTAPSKAAVPVPSTFPSWTDNDQVASKMLGLSSVRLAEGRNARADIVIAADATRVARFAALDLKHHLDKITGANFKIVTDAEARAGRYALCVGPSRRTKLQQRDFALQQWAWTVAEDHAEFVGYDSDKRGLPSLVVTDGGSASGTNWPHLFDPQGTMYAVYEFLEKECGVCWCDETDLGTVYPKRSRLDVACKTVRGEPFIAYRGGCGLEEWYWPLHFADNVPESKLYKKIGFAQPKNFDRQTVLFRLRHRACGDRAPANHSFYHWYARFSQPKHPHFEGAHPEYFAVGYPSNSTPPQLCYTSEAVIRQVVKDAREYIADPDHNIKYRNDYWGEGYWGHNHFGLEPMDNSSFCQCAKCKAFHDKYKDLPDHSRHSTYWFTFVNRVAKELKKTNPTAKIITLAYGSHEGLPDLQLEDNVIVYFCYSSNRMPNVDHAGQRARMVEWRKAYPKQPLALWLYNCFPELIAKWGHFNCFPGYFAHLEAEQYQFFKQYNIRAGVFHCGFNGKADNYLQLAYMLDPDRDPDELLNEYFSMYGAAAKPMREFYDLVERRYCDKTLYPKGSGHQTFAIAWGCLGTPEVMAKLGDCVKRAESAAVTDAEKRRVQLFAISTWTNMVAGFNKFCDRKAAACPDFTCVRIPDAAGDIAKVAWAQIPAIDQKLYMCGSPAALKKPAKIRLANDSTHFYLEITSMVDPKKITISPAIAPCDTWEILLERRLEKPYRYYLSGGDGRLGCSSNGEVGWRDNVSATETMGDPTFKAKCVSDRSQKDRWVMRWSFPLAHATDQPLKPGDTFYLNATAVWHHGLVGEHVDSARWAILTFTPYTEVHTADRAATVHLAR